MAGRLGCRFPVYSAADSDFNYDYNLAFHRDQLEGGTTVYNYEVQSWRLPDAPGVSVFAKGEHGGVFHTYSTYARGIDTLNNAFQYRELVPKGRNEERLTFSPEEAPFRGYAALNQRLRAADPG
jgi:predicted dithiol-disulfide oxidoreductase (DUF899 family)